jgi:hypothetical protein
MLASIAKRQHGYTALCESCSAPLAREPEGRWAPAIPLSEARDRELSRTGSR